MTNHGKKYGKPVTERFIDVIAFKVTGSFFYLILERL